jgi:CubicO group peptidase (beta-lactamase class C family)
MEGGRRVSVALAVAIAGCLIVPERVSAAPWTDPAYLYRYVFWGVPSLFSKSDQYRRFPYRPIDNGSERFHFVPGPEDAVPQFVEYHHGDRLKRISLDELLQTTDTHAFIVIRDDEVLYEDYLNGYQRDSLNESWSLAKSFVSALVGVALAEGLIRSVDAPIVDYLPELKNRGFDPITIRNLLTMGSGIRYRLGLFPWDEFALAGFYPDLRKLLLSDLEVVEPPGQSFHYNNFNTELMGMILERVTHRTLSEYLQEKIWKPLGMEYPAIWSTDSEADGLELSATLLEARPIDFAKFGRLFLKRGNWNGIRIVPESWVVESTSPDPNDHRPWETFSPWRDSGGYYKYFWWGTSKGSDEYSFQGIGTYGQFIYVSPKARVVIVRTAEKDGIDPREWREVFQYIADHMRAELRSSSTARDAGLKN